MKAQTLVPLAAAAAAQLLVVGNIAAAFAFQQKPPVETLVTVPVVAEIEPHRLCEMFDRRHQFRNFILLGSHDRLLIFPVVSRREW